jgi:hypothetical protein
LTIVPATRMVVEPGSITFILTLGGPDADRRNS